MTASSLHPLPEPKLAAVDWDLCISVSLKFKSSYRSRQEDTKAQRLAEVVMNAHGNITK